MRDKIQYYLRIVITTGMLAYGVVAMTSIEWYWIIAAVLYTNILNDIFCHRICSHGMFKINTESKLYKILTWLASADMGYGPVKWITISHNLHHIYSDNGPEDVMNWRYHWYSTTIVSPIPRFTDVKPADYQDYVKKQIRKHTEIMSDPWTNFCAKYQGEISIVTLLTLFLISPTLFSVVCIGRVILSVMTGLAGFIGHIKHFPLSYRNFDTKDTTSNNIIAYYCFFGLFAGMLQNNHHGQPRSVRPNPNWWEIDTSLPFVLLLKRFIEKND